MDVQVAGIDALQFQMEGTAAHFAGADGIAGHAVDHGNPERGGGTSERLYSRGAKPENARNRYHSFGVHGPTSQPPPAGRISTGRICHSKPALRRWLFHRLPGQGWFRSVRGDQGISSRQPLPER